MKMWMSAWQLERIYNSNTLLDKMKRSRITCQILKEQYKELQNIAESYEKK